MRTETIDRDRIALAVQQPWADLIVRGHKTIEIRSTAASVRGPIYIYASRKPSELPEAVDVMRRHGLDLAELSRGVIVGAAELVECRPAFADDTLAALVEPARLIGRTAWRFEQPIRFAEPLSPRFVPYGIWFYPFRRKDS